jgi:hypothetical protein
VIVFDAVAEEKLRAFLGSFPPWSYRTAWRFAMTESSELLVGLIENVALLLEGHVGRVFM